MTTAIKRRRGTTAQHATFTGLEGELTVDTTKDTVVVHDGATAGGFPLAKESQATTNVAITGGSISGITDLAVADGGTGASTADNARTNLGVTATGADTTYAFRANNLSDLASASTARTNLGLGTIATQAASSVAITGGSINNTPIGASTANTGAFTTLGATGVATFSAGTVSAPAITTTGDTNTGIFFPAADTIAFTEGGVESMRIDSSGNVGIGTSSPNAYGAGVTALTLNASTVVTYDLNVGGTRYGAITGLANELRVTAVGASAVNTFFTNGAERMRITPNGDVAIAGTTSLSGTTRLNIHNVTSGNNGIGIQNSLDTGTIYSVYIRNSSSTLIGSITNNGSVTLFNTTSDYRLKNVISNISDAGQRIDALEPIEYEWKTGGKTRGFLAHKFAEVYPDSVSGEKDAVDANGKPKYQGMQASTPEVMADLIAEIQSLRKRVAQLES